MCNLLIFCKLSIVTTCISFQYHYHAFSFFKQKLYRHLENFFLEKYVNVFFVERAISSGAIMSFVSQNRHLKKWQVKQKVA